jgi:hypothetical protein
MCKNLVIYNENLILRDNQSCAKSQYCMALFKNHLIKKQYFFTQMKFKNQEIIKIQTGIWLTY